MKIQTTPLGSLFRRCNDLTQRRKGAKENGSLRLTLRLCAFAGTYRSSQVAEQVLQECGYRDRRRFSAQGATAERDDMEIVYRRLLDLFI